LGRHRNFALFELLSHGQMLLEMGKRFCRPPLQFGIIPILGIRIKKRDCIFVRLDLDLIIVTVEFPSRSWLSTRPAFSDARNQAMSAALL
jgi:hypothetical protein